MVLALAMMLSIMVVGAGAVFTDSDKIDAAHQDAVEIATQLNIINGYPDGSFQPQGDVTRAEISKMICIALNGGEVPATAVKAEPSYSDIQGNWAEGFIEYCTAKGIIAGYPDGTFKPGNNVTAAEAAKMMLVALGYDPKAENYEGDGWDLYVNVQANQDGLYAKLLDIQTTEALSREHTAQMVWNMLQAFTVEKSTSVDRTDGSITDVYAKTETTLFWESYRGYKGGAQMVGFDYDKDGAEWTYYLDVNYNFLDQQVGKDKFYGNANLEFTSDKDYTALLGHDVQVIFNIDNRNATYKANQGTAYGIFNDSSVECVTANFGDIAKMTDKNFNNDTVKIGDNTYRLQDGLTFATIPVYEFRAVTDITARQAFQGGAAGNTVLEDVIGSDDAGQITRYDPQQFTAVDEDGNGKVDFLITTPFSFVKVETLNGTKVQLYGAFVDNVIDGVVLNETASTKRWLSDEVSMYDGMAKGDYVKYTAAANTATDVDLLEKPDDVFSGAITKSDYPDVTVGGNGYTFVDEYFYTGKGTTSAAAKNGNTLTDANVINGYIFRVEGLKRATFDDYAVVTGAGVDAFNTAQAKLLFANGTTATVDTDQNYTGLVGKLVDYFVRDGEYYLTAVDPTEGPHGDYTIWGPVADVSDISNSNHNIGNIADSAGNWADINDDAVVFVKYLKDNGDVAWKTITGKQLKVNPTANVNLASTENTIVLATADAPNSSKNHAEFVYIDLTANGVITSKDFYGYVMSTGEDANGMKTLELWTADGVKNVTYNDSNILAVSSNGTRYIDPQNEVIDSGMAIRYKTTSDESVITEILGFYNMETEDITANNSADGFYARTIAITGLPSSDPNDKFTFVDYALSGGKMVPNAENVFAPDGSYFDIDDADVLFVDIDTDQSYTGELDTASRNENGYVSNAMMVYEYDGTVDLIVYFVDGE